MLRSCLQRTSANMGVCIAINNKAMGCKNNGGCGCNGMTIQQGDAFSLVFQYKEKGESTTLPQGYDLIVGIYGMDGTLLKSAKLSDGSITQRQNGTYEMRITHSDSMGMLAQVTMELTIKNADGSIIDHASNVVTINIEPRRNNALID